MRLLVLMSDNRVLEKTIGNAQYNSLVAAINYEYCSIHGYDFIYYRPYLIDRDACNLNISIDPITKTQRHAAWAKLLSTSLALNLDYDYVVYIDSDCIFKDFNQSLEDFIKPYLQNNVVFLNNKPWHTDRPCSGFFIVKVNETTKQFFDIWYSFDFNGRINPCRFEQGAVWSLFTIPQYNIAIVDAWMFKEEKCQFLRHVGTHDDRARMPYFSAFIQSNSIKYEENISKIRVIEFDTHMQ